MWYDGTYSCGHEGRTNVVGPTKDRAWKAERHFSGLCPECAEKARQEEIVRKNKEAAEKTAEMELPELTGTEKQIAWANSLRIDVLDMVGKEIERVAEQEKEAKERNKRRKAEGKEAHSISCYAHEKNADHVRTTKEELSDALDYAIQKHTDSRYWIDSRNNWGLIQDMVDEYRKEGKIKKVEIPQEIAEELEEEGKSLIVSPETEEKKSGVAVISYNSSSNILSAGYAKDDKFREIVKGFGFSWSGYSWEKKITEFTGTTQERAAELGNKLLLSGFTVQFPDVVSKEKAISGNFSPECKRWVKYSGAKEKLGIVWDGRSDTIYNAAKSLPKAKYDSGAVYVPVEFYREAQDFAETLGFCFSKKAMEAIAEYQKKEEGFEKAAPVETEKGTVSDGEMLKKALKSGGTILEDLLDEA